MVVLWWFMHVLTQLNFVVVFLFVLFSANLSVGLPIFGSLSLMCLMARGLAAIAQYLQESSMQCGFVSWSDDIYSVLWKVCFIHPIGKHVCVCCASSATINRLLTTIALSWTTTQDEHFIGHFIKVEIKQQQKKWQIINNYYACWQHIRQCVHTTYEREVYRMLLHMHPFRSFFPRNFVLYIFINQNQIK